MAIFSRGNSPQPRALPALLIIALLLALASCGDDEVVDWGDCDPLPEITSSPPREATVNETYSYSVTARYICLPFFCHSVEPVHLPAGATMENNLITWTPAASSTNTDVYFEVITRHDSCANRVTQSWTVHVFPAPP